MMPIVGYIGYGEAAYYLSKGLKEEGLKTQFAFDIHAQNNDHGAVIQKRANDTATVLMESLEQLVAQCDIIICSTSAKAMERIAENVKGLLTSDHLYVDMNASSSERKVIVNNHIKDSNAKFVDAAAMGSFPATKHQTPFYLSGDGARQFLQFGATYNMDITYISERPGDASAIKMYRSIFMKGLATLLWETIEASYKDGVNDYVLHSIHESIAGKTVIELVNGLLPRTMVHAKRRVVEMEEVIKTLIELNVDETLSRAIRDKLIKIAENDMAKTIRQEAPNNYIDIFKKLISSKKGDEA